MIKVNNMPVINIHSIKNELIERGVGCKYVNNIRQLMFDDGYMNDVYVSYYIDDDICDKYYTDKEQAKVEQMIIDILREACPDSNRVLVDVSW